MLISLEKKNYLTHFFTYFFRESESRPKLIACGNVLLDMSVETLDNYVLKKHQLKEDDQCEVTLDIINEIVKDATDR